MCVKQSGRFAEEDQFKSWAWMLLSIALQKGMSRFHISFDSEKIGRDTAARVPPATAPEEIMLMNLQDNAEWV